MSKLTTPVFRASYANVWEPAPSPSGDMKYSISMIFPKDTDLTAVKKAIEDCVIDALGSDKSKWPKGLKNPLRDGDTDRDSPEYQNSFFLNAGSKNQPGIVGPNVQPLLDRDEFYSGCYARATINFFYYDKNGNRGVGVGLNNLMKVKDGERFDGRRTAEDDFSSFVVADQSNSGF